MKILIIGMDSFTGSYLKTAFESRDHIVFGTTSIAQHANANCLFADFKYPETIASVLYFFAPDVIVNLAALSFVAENQVAPFYAVNVSGTAALFENVRRILPNIHVIIQPSSANIYGEQEGILDEKTHPYPVNHYAKSKWAMEVMLQGFDDLPIVITRPFNYTGVGQSERFLIAKMVEHFKKKSPVIELGNLDVARDFTDVRDVARAYVGLAENVQSGIFNIASGRSLSLKRIFDELQRQSHHTMEIQVNPQLVRQNEIKNLIGNADKLTQAIGQWRKIPNFAETLSWMLSE